MNEPYILGTLKRHLNPAHPFGVLNDAAPIVKSLTGISPEEKEGYLKKNRDAFLDSIKSGSGDEVAFQIEAALDMLAYFWKDASEIYNDSDDGIGMDGVTWSLVKTYYFETINYTAQLYRLHLLHPTDELYNIEQKFKGLSLAQIHQVIIDSGLLSQKRIAQLEQKAQKANTNSRDTGGKIIGIPWSGEEAVDSISQYFEDSSSLNMGVITEMGKRFRQICREKARDKDSTREEKEIWVRAVVNALNALFVQANRSNMNMIYELSSSYCAIVEEEFMQIPEPICVKHLAAEIDSTAIFEEVVFLANASPEGSTIPCTYNQFLLTEDMGEANLELYQKKLCENCDVGGCPYDIYMRKYQMDGIGISGKYDFNPPKEDDHKPDSYIDDCHEFLCDPSIASFLEAVCLSLHIPSKWQDAEFDEEKKKDFIDKNIVPRDRYLYDYSISLTQELSDHIKCLKGDDLELSNFIDDFLSPFYELSIILHPVGSEYTDLLRFVIFTCASGLVNCSFRDFHKILSDSVEAIQAQHHSEDYDCTIDLIKEILDRAPEKDYQPKDRIFAAIHEIKTSLTFVEAALEAALLDAGIANDYIFYEDEVGINMGRQVNDVMLYLVTRKTPQSLVSRIKRLGHRTKYGIKDGEDMYDYAKRVFRGEDTDDTDHTAACGNNDSPSAIDAAGSSDDLLSRSSGNASETTGEQSPAFVFSDRMQEHLDKAKAYIKDAHWWNDDKKQYAIFLKVLYCKVFRKDWSNNVRWVKLPIYPLRDGTQLTISQLKGALRDYNDDDYGGIRKTFENLFQQ